MNRAGGAGTATQPGTANMSRPSSGYQGGQRTSQPVQSSRSYSSQPATRPQLERDYGARQQGAQRSHNYNRQGGARRRH